VLALTYSLINFGSSKVQHSITVYTVKREIRGLSKHHRQINSSKTSRLWQKLTSAFLR